MRPRRDPVPRARDSWVWLGGILLLGFVGAGVAAAAQALWENVDIRQLAPELAEAPPPPPVPELPRAPAAPGGPFLAAVFDSPRNAAFFPDSTFHVTAVERWSAAAEGVGASVRRVRDAQGIRALAPEVVLLVPESPCLSAEERSAILGHLDQGGGVVSNWAPGARDEVCQWVGWDFTARLNQATDVRELPAREALFLTVPAGVPLSVGLDPGTRINLRPDPSIALRKDGPRIYWSDWALNASPDESGGGADVGATAFRTASGGRVAWFGGRLRQASGRLDALRLLRLVQNGILWAAGRPSAAPAPWPEGRRAALMVTVDVEEGWENVVPVADYLDSLELPGTFFAVTQLVEGEEELGRRLLQTGEVGSQTTDHVPLAGLTAQNQTLRLRRSWDEVRRWVGQPPDGLRPPRETFDALTLAAWARTGGGYLVGINDARSGAPEIHDTDEGSVIVLPRLLKDDYNVFVQEGAVRAERLAEAWLEGTAKLRTLEGLAVISGRTQILSTRGRLNALGTVLDSARAQGDWWFAEGRQVAGWWRQRHGIRLTFVDPSPEPEPLDAVAPRVALPDLLVEAPEAPDPFSGTWVDVALPAGAEGVVPWVDGAPSDFALTSTGMRIPVGEIGGGIVRRVAFRAETGDGARS